MATRTINTTWLNKTVNKTRRTSRARLLGVLWHETASRAVKVTDPPVGTLEWNRLPRLVNGKVVRSSYNYLIARNGTIYHYVDELGWIAWHGGEAQWNEYTDDINDVLIGVEVDGPNDGTPITAQQRAAIVWLMRHFRDKYGIPLERKYHPEHCEVALPEGRKTDAKGFNVTQLLDEARSQPAPTPAPAPAPAPKRWIIPTSSGQVDVPQALYDFYHDHGGLLVFGYPTSDDYQARDASGEVCTFWDLENGRIKIKPSQPAPWNVRLAPRSEIPQPI